MSMPQVGSGLPRLLAERYELSEPLASGKLTSVWLGHDRVLGRDVVIKVLQPELASDPALQSSFHQEAVNAARLTHPNIVALYDTGEQDGVAYIVMERVDGPSLQELLARQGALSPARAARLAIEIALALDYAHHAGVVHGNLKPGNILFTQDGTVKVSDFAIAQAATDEDLVRTGELLGTSYLIPEQVRGQELNGRADVYSLGVCLYEMLTGRPPYKPGLGVASAIAAASSNPISPRSVRAGVPRELDAIVVKAMAKDPAARYPTAQTMASALARFAAADDGEPATSVFAPARPAPTEPAMPEPGFIRHEGRWLGWTLLLVGIAAVLVVIGLSMARRPISIGPLTIGKQPPVASAPESTPAGRPLPIAAASAYDPYSQDGQENNANTGKAVDGDPATFWRTETYTRPNAGNLKPGVGLVVDLGSPRAARTLRITLNTPGGQAAVYAADQMPDSFAGWQQLAASQALAQQTTLRLPGGPHRYYLVWFTSLPVAAGGGYRAEVDEVALLS